MSSKGELLQKAKLYSIKIPNNFSKAQILEKIEAYEGISKMQVVLKEDNTEVKKIFHLSDIHIRILERHEEYSQVFQKLYQQIDLVKENKLMVICGDIFHQKDRFASETMIVFNELITNLVSRIDVVMILGNHDCFINNKNRLDTISGFTHLSKINNLYILKNSGYYQYNNILFGVSSIVDELFMLNPESLSECVKIGLYHGYVSDKDALAIQPDVFNNYDITMLGDTHKQLFLNKQKTIAYSGSLIQQNFKEEVSHGFLLWDIPTLSADFIELKNDWTFRDINIHTDDVSKYEFSKNTRIRLLLNPEDLESDISKITEEIKKKTNIVSLKTIMKNVVNYRQDSKKIEQKSEIRETDIIKNILKDDIHLQRIVDIHKELSMKIETTDMNYKNSVPWAIRSIEFMNIFCYGNDILNVIDFKKGITGILASNASGKTNILNTILYGLFGNIYSRNQNENNRNIVSRSAGKKELYVKLIVETQDNKTYSIIRTCKMRNRTNSGVLMTEKLDFYNELENLNGATKVETEKKLRETLSFSTKEDFMLTNMISNISYGFNISIISMNGTQLDETFNNMFNLNKFKLLHDTSKGICKDLSTKMKSYQSKIELLTSSLSKYDISKVKTEHSQETRQSLFLQEIIKNLEIRVDELDEELKNYTTMAVKADKLQIKKRIKENDTSIAKITNDIVSLAKKEKFYEGEYSKMVEEYRDNGYSSFVKLSNPNTPVREILEIEKDISYYSGKKQDISFTSDISEEYLQSKKFLKEYRSDNVVDTNLIKQIIKNLKKLEKSTYYILSENEREMLLSNLEKTYIDPNLLLKYQKIVSDKENRDKIINENIFIVEKINSLKKELKNNKIMYAHQLKKQIDESGAILKAIDLYYDNKKLIKDLETLDKNKNYTELLTVKTNIVEELSEKRKQLKVLDNSLTRNSVIIETYEDNLKNKKEYENLLESLAKELKIYKKYSDITHSKNLPKLLISNIVKNICEDANNLIYNTTGLMCEIKENEKWEISIKKGNQCIGPEHCSGYEKFVINTSLKITFDRYKQLSSIKMFLIDEVIDCVSEDNYEQVDIVLEYLKKHYESILLISHNEMMKTKVDNRINLIKYDNYSCVDSSTS